MLITMLTAMYVMVKVIGVRFAQKDEPLPYMVSQPLPWQVHSVSHSRRSSKAEEFGGYRRNSMGVYRKEKAASTIQNHFRKFQQKKHKNDK
uniref:Uncharacterized protein n=1 Tax=Poecilia reticulata TaxID=8081 RepID=A0A3P9QHE9_POERE